MSIPSKEEVMEFAEAMFNKLNTPKNIPKPHWKTETLPTLLRCLEDEVDELDEAIFFVEKQRGGKENVKLEACDVANFAFMIWQKAGGS